MTNGERLAATYRACTDHCERECESLRLNESSWGMYVLEPALEVLGWPRRFEDDDPAVCDGAYFEYPEDKAADIALLSGGRLFAFGELKQHGESGCKADIRKHRRKHAELQDCPTAFSGWFGKGGDCAIYSIASDSTLTNVARRDAPWNVLSYLAKPVLLGTQSREAWEQSRAPSDQLPQARMSLCAIMEHFFDGVFDYWKLPRDRPYRYRAIINLETCADSGTPWITFAHKDLHPVLPKGWGITLNLDPIRNKASCNFFERSEEALPTYSRQRVSFGPNGNPSAIDELVSDVNKRIEQRRQEALARELL